jgi:hypothetical protein
MSFSAEAVRDVLRFELLDARIRGAVEAVAATDPNPADPFRGLYISDDLALSLARDAAENALDVRLGDAVAALGLDLLDASVLALCAAPELSPRYGRLYAYLHDDVTRKLASPRLVARLLEGDGVGSADVLACFAEDAPLRRNGAIRLLDPNGQAPLAERLVKTGDRLAAHLLGSHLDTEPTGGRLRRVPLPARDPGRPEVVERLRALLAPPTHLPLVAAGPDAPLLVASALGRPLLLVDVAEVLDEDLMRDAMLAAALERSRLCFDGLESLEPGERRRVLRALRARRERVVICASSRDAVASLAEDTAVVEDVPLPTFAERRTAWAAAGTEDVGEVAAKFRLSVAQIEDAVEAARLAAASRCDGIPSAADLHLGARLASSTRLGELAIRLEPAFGWEDLVVPEPQQELLRSISSYLRHRDLVLSEWGYERTVARTQGLKVLFAGESGTGKTMAGQVLARDLGLDLFRIDLATVVSKYIGETEKNLDRIFGAAQGSNAILFFDEADALFGKRSEVRDSHDRYANIEVAYLLQKMEAYEGAVILATNFRQNMDDAFLRRLDIVVDFPFPEADDRRRIWKLVLPPAAPVADDVDVDFLAAQFKLSGGSIRNCSLSAAFMAAEASEPIAMRHLVRAVALEYGKLGRLTLEADFERFHELIRPGNGGATTTGKAERARSGY